MNKIDFAIEVAAKAHRNQVRKHTDIPYITHPISVGMTLQKYGYSEELIIAGILHDTIEDTPIDIDYIISGPLHEITEKSAIKYGSVSIAVKKSKSGIIAIW